jgi:urea-proton symporter
MGLGERDSGQKTGYSLILTGCAALTFSPSFPTFPDPLTAAQNGAGLSSPASAIALLGKGGAILMLILLFMAVTSSTSAELIAVSSLLTFDVYKTYIKPDSSSERLVQISHYGIIIYGLVLAAFCCILNAAGLNLTWLLTVLGIIVGGASVPVGLVLLWARMSTVAAIASPWIGLACGLIAWFVTTAKRSGHINVTTTGDTTNAVAGNITSWGTGFLIAIILSFIFPAKHVSTNPKDIERYNKIHGVAPTKCEEQSPSHSSPVPSEKGSKETNDDEITTAPTDQSGDEKTRSTPEPETYVPTGNELVDFLETQQMAPTDPVLAKKAARLAIGANVVFVAIAMILVPFTLFGTGYICEYFYVF